MSADSIREQVVQAITARLATMTEAGGYSMTPGVVARAVRQFEPGQLPAVSVWDQDEESAPGYGFEARAMTVLVECFTDASGEDYSTAGNRLLADVKRALLSYSTPLDDLARDVAYEGGTINYPEPGGDVVATEQRLIFTYLETLGEPDQQPEI